MTERPNGNTNSEMKYHLCAYELPSSIRLNSTIGKVEKQKNIKLRKEKHPKGISQFIEISLFRKQIYLCSSFDHEQPLFLHLNQVNAASNVSFQFTF